MKQKLLVLLFILCFQFLTAQPPTGYYNSATGSGYTLKTQLKNIISNGHVDRGYGALYDAYEKTDTDAFYENDNTVLDMYSENPSGTDPYNYSHGSRKCGNYNSENDCYNREHIFPQGFFNSRTPMRTDVHHVVPSDGSVNGRRSNYPFGEISNPTHTSQNGSKVGVNTFESVSKIVFEPLDEFKGDIARMLFYFATRYEDEVTSNEWDNPNSSESNPLNGTNNQVYESWYIRLLYKWHINDPVNQREIVRNNESYNFQGNRNPFIDNPEYVSEIWGSVLATETISLTTIKLYPNPTNGNIIYVDLDKKAKIEIFNVLGKRIITTTLSKNEKEINITNLSKGIYLVKINIEGRVATRKLVHN